MNARRIILSCLLVALVPFSIWAADYTIKAGSTNVSVYFVMDTNNNPDVVTYIRDGEAVGSLTAGAELAQTDSRKRQRGKNDIRLPQFFGHHFFQFCHGG